jgi:hypothetical protein
MEEERKTLKTLVSYLEQKYEAIEQSIRDSMRGNNNHNFNSPGGWDRQTFGANTQQSPSQENFVGLNPKNNALASNFGPMHKKYQASGSDIKNLNNMWHGMPVGIDSIAQNGDQEEMTVFHSVMYEDDIFAEVSNSFIIHTQRNNTFNTMPDDPQQSNQFFPNILPQEFSNPSNRQSFPNSQPALWDRKLALLQTDAYRQFPLIETAAKRTQLPAFKDPSEKLNIWALIKDLIGKDLTRIALPVYLNEPLSFCQRFVETLEYRGTIDTGAQLIRSDP